MCYNSLKKFTKGKGEGDREGEPVLLKPNEAEMMEDLGRKQEMQSFRN